MVGGRLGLVLGGRGRRGLVRPCCFHILAPIQFILSIFCLWLEERGSTHIANESHAQFLSAAHSSSRIEYMR
jgi:hypothetical protein